MTGLPQQSTAPALVHIPTITREAQADKLVGRIVTFFPHVGCVDRCLRRPNTPRYAGQIISAAPLPPTARGGIPDVSVTVRGRTGKTATVSLTVNFVSFWETWKDALLDQ